MSIFRLGAVSLATALCLASCGHKSAEAPGGAIMSALGQQMPRCKTSKKDILYTANIIIHPIGSDAPRNVNLAVGDAPKNDITGEQNNTGEADFKNEPFHIFLKKEIIKNGEGFIKVRLIIPKTTKLDFVTRGRLNGASIKADKGALCDNTIDSPDGYPDISSVAIFFIDLNGMKSAAQFKGDLVPFNILVKSVGSKNTPIIIDPAVRNEG